MSDLDILVIGAGATGLPVCKLLGGPLCEGIKVYKGIGSRNTDDAVERARGTVAQDFFALKTESKAP